MLLVDLFLCQHKHSSLSELMLAKDQQMKEHLMYLEIGWLPDRWLRLGL